MEKETQSKTIISVIAIIALICGSCATHYVPNVINAPLLAGKGETSLALHTGMSGVDPQFSVAITDQFALMFNASFANREYEYENEESDKYHKHQFAEIAAGYLMPSDGDIRLEGFGGIGRGRTRALDYTWDQDKIDSRFTRAFLQYSAGLSTESLEGSASLRMAMLHFDDRQLGTGFYMEPTLTGKAGSTWLKFVFQIGFSLQLNMESNLIPYNPFMISIGLEAKPGRKAKSKNNVTAHSFRLMH